MNDEKILMVILIIAKITIKQKPFLYYNTRQLEGRAGETNGQVSDKGLAPPRCAYFCNTIIKTAPPDLTFGPKSKIPRITGSQVCKWQPCATSKSKWNCFAFHWQKEKSNLIFHLIHVEHQSFTQDPKRMGVGPAVLLRRMGWDGVCNIYNLVISLKKTYKRHPSSELLHCYHIFRYYSQWRIYQKHTQNHFLKIRCRSILNQIESYTVSALHNLI